MGPENMLKACYIITGKMSFTKPSTMYNEHMLIKRFLEEAVIFLTFIPRDPLRDFYFSFINFKSVHRHLGS